MLSLPQALPLPIPRVTRAVEARLHQVRAHPLLNPVAFEELWRERAGHAVDAVHRPHLLAALEWLERAQDATGAGGFARGYSLAWSPYFKSRGWQPAYPETTGYIIPTLYEAARRLNRPDLASRAERAARWEVEIQLPSGAVRGGVMGERTSPAVFNTGQVLFGWLAAFAHSGSGVFAAAERIAAAVGPDGRLPGRFAAGWSPAAPWSCLTGEAQMANIWLRLFEITGERKWLEPVEPVLRFLKATQNRTSRDTGLRGGVKGSFPLGAEYGPFQTLNWATKFFADALMRGERVGCGNAREAETAADAVLA